MTGIESQARAEAEAIMAEAREQVGLTVRDQQRYIEGFTAGAAWAASRPASPATRETVTEEMVERAARVLHPAGLGPWDEAKDAWRERTLMLARAALEAALGGTGE